MCPLNLQRSSCITRYKSVAPAMRRNCAASDPSEKQPRLSDPGDEPDQPPPWEYAGSISAELFVSMLVPWALFVIGFGSNMIRNLMPTATGPGEGLRRILNIIPEHASEELKRFTQKSAAIEYPFNSLAALAALIVTIVLWKRAKKKGKTTFSEYYQTHAKEDDAQKEWMKAMYIAPAAFQTLSLNFWIGVRGLARAMAEMDKEEAKSSFKIYSNAVDDIEKIVDLYGKVVNTIKEKGVEHSDVTKKQEALQTEMDKICRLRAIVNNTTKSASSFIDDESLTQKKTMEQINSLFKYQSFAASHCKNAEKDGVIYWLNHFINTGALEKRKVRRNDAIKFLNKINQYAQLMGLRPQDNQARWYAAEFMRFSAFGTAEQVWNKAYEFYHQCEKTSPTVAMMLPDYHDMMDSWAEKYPQRAQKNLRAHGLRYPAYSGD